MVSANPAGSAYAYVSVYISIYIYICRPKSSPSREITKWYLIVDLGQRKGMSLTNKGALPNKNDHIFGCVQKKRLLPKIWSSFQAKIVWSKSFLSYKMTLQFAWYLGSAPVRWVVGGVHYSSLICWPWNDCGRPTKFTIWLVVLI